MSSSERESAGISSRSRFEHTAEDSGNPKRNADLSVENQNWIRWFRQTSPYINANRGKRLVIALSGDALDHENLIDIVHDVAMLNSLGVKIVLVFGARPQINRALHQAGIDDQVCGKLRVTSARAMPHVLQAAGGLRCQLEALLSAGMANSPMHGASIKVISGNFVMSRPVGVLDGVDYGFTGRVRKVDAQAIQQFLDQQAIVLLPSIGYSLTGEAFNLSYEDVAASVASAIGAHKLIMFSEQGGILDGNGDLIRELSLARAQRLLAQVEGVPPQDALDPECRDLLAFICTACHQGVDRSYVLSFQHEGALLQEMFTRDGLGTMISAQDYEQIRPAKLTDIGGISELLRPLEEQGILIRRSRELLEMEIDKFTVDERDGGIIGCAALYPYPSERIGELACFAVSSRYRRHGRGDTLLQIIEDKARRLKLNRIFALTTQTEHWFRERGFVPASINELPESKRAAYNNQRNSKLFIKML